MKINTDVNVKSPSAFTIRNHAFNAAQSSVIKSESFNVKAPSAFTIRNHAFNA